MIFLKTIKKKLLEWAVLGKAWEISVFIVPNKGPFVSADRRTDGRMTVRLWHEINIPFFLKK